MLDELILGYAKTHKMSRWKKSDHGGTVWIDMIHGYRNSHRSLKEGHPFERLSDHEYLRSIGAAAISDEDGQLHSTAAGMLMFGDEYNIVRHFPEYFLDYREELDPTTRWSDRL